ncbi:hypothetical protein CDAR_256901 [Caerostris darwini]|uniref:Uncharacterized protein n=1 Tax=Caerostris darwini TaxID=1538125 RepID=A0AAV4PZP7_9ARAC|nr:hypothetical protein CDAR_256901 [Caerostris darwini]
MNCVFFNLLWYDQRVSNRRPHFHSLSICHSYFANPPISHEAAMPVLRKPADRCPKRSPKTQPLIKIRIKLYEHARPGIKTSQGRGRKIRPNFHPNDGSWRSN